MIKSLANKIHLNERLYTFSMANGAPIQNHFDDFNSILINLESIDVTLEDEDNVILLIVSLPSSYKHFKKILLYSTNETLSFEDVKASLLPKEKFDLKLRSNDNSEGLNVRDRPFEKWGTTRRNSRSKSRRRKSHKFCKLQETWILS